MTFASEFPCERFPTSDAGSGGLKHQVAALDPFLYQEMHSCPNCGGKGPAIFVLVYETEFGRVGYCMGCGEERVQLFSRTTSEAA